MIPFGPNWYAAVMGTGIVAIAFVSLPVPVPGSTGLAVAWWLLAAALLVAVLATSAYHRRRDPGMARRHLHDPVMSHFYGAPAMALLTVGAGAVSTGVPGGLAIDAVLWTVGTLLGLWTAVAVPYHAITVHAVADDSAGGAWLMPVVPPMVSATTGALLVPHLPDGQAQETLLLLCYCCFGVTLIAGLLVLGQVWQRLVRHGVGAPATVPTVWIVLGFLGQSITAVHHLGALAPAVVPQYGHALRSLTLCYGVPVWGFALVWLALAGALTVRQVRVGMPFAPTWWSFTFPVGTVVTGTSALAQTTGLELFEGAAALAMLGLLSAWSVVAARTTATFLDAARARRRQRADARTDPGRGARTRPSEGLVPQWRLWFTSLSAAPAARYRRGRERRDLPVR